VVQGGGIYQYRLFDNSNPHAHHRITTFELYIKNITKTSEITTASLHGRQYQVQVHCVDT